MIISTVVCISYLFSDFLCSVSSKNLVFMVRGITKQICFFIHWDNLFLDDVVLLSPLALNEARFIYNVLEILEQTFRC